MNSLSIFGFALPQRNAPPEPQVAVPTPIAQRKSAEARLNELCAELGIPLELSGDMSPHTYVARMQEVMIYLLERERDQR